MENKRKANYIVVGISGKIGSGKDTIADRLGLWYGFEKRSLAEPMKEGCKELFGFTHDQVYGDRKAEIDSFWQVTPRRVLQIIGTEMFRVHLPKVLPEIDWVEDKFWVKRWLKWYENCGRMRVMVSDIRFPNEAMMVQQFNQVEDHKGILIRVNRDMAGDSFVAQHKSETELDDFRTFDYVIENDSDIPHLWEKVDKIMEMEGIKLDRNQNL